MERTKHHKTNSLSPQSRGSSKRSTRKGKKAPKKLTSKKGLPAPELKELSKHFQSIDEAAFLNGVAGLSSIESQEPSARKHVKHSTILSSNLNYRGDPLEMKTNSALILESSRETPLDIQSERQIGNPYLEDQEEQKVSRNYLSHKTQNEIESLEKQISSDFNQEQLDAEMAEFQMAYFMTYTDCETFNLRMVGAKFLKYREHQRELQTHQLTKSKEQEEELSAVTEELEASRFEKSEKGHRRFKTIDAKNEDVKILEENRDLSHDDLYFDPSEQVGLVPLVNEMVSPKQGPPTSEGRIADVKINQMSPISYHESHRDQPDTHRTDKVSKQGEDGERRQPSEAGTLSAKSVTHESLPIEENPYDVDYVVENLSDKESSIELDPSLIRAEEAASREMVRSAKRRVSSSKRSQRSQKSHRSQQRRSSKNKQSPKNAGKKSPKISPPSHVYAHRDDTISSKIEVQARSIRVTTNSIENDDKSKITSGRRQTSRDGKSSSKERIEVSPPNFMFGSKKERDKLKKIRKKVQSKKDKTFVPTAKQQNEHDMFIQEQLRVSQGICNIITSKSRSPFKGPPPTSTQKLKETKKLKVEGTEPGSPGHNSVTPDRKRRSEMGKHNNPPKFLVMSSRVTQSLDSQANEARYEVSKKSIFDRRNSNSSQVRHSTEDEVTIVSKKDIDRYGSKMLGTGEKSSRLRSGRQLPRTASKPRVNQRTKNPEQLQKSGGGEIQRLDKTLGSKNHDLQVSRAKSKHRQVIYNKVSSKVSASPTLKTNLSSDHHGDEHNQIVVKSDVGKPVPAGPSFVLTTQASQQLMKANTMARNKSNAHLSNGSAYPISVPHPQSARRSDQMQKVYNNKKMVENFPEFKERQSLSLESYRQASREAESKFTKFKKDFKSRKDAPLVSGRFGSSGQVSRNSSPTNENVLAFSKLKKSCQISEEDIYKHQFQNSYLQSNQELVAKSVLNNRAIMGKNYQKQKGRQTFTQEQLNKFVHEERLSNPSHIRSESEIREPKFLPQLPSTHAGDESDQLNQTEVFGVGSTSTAHRLAGGKSIPTKGSKKGGAEIKLLPTIRGEHGPLMTDRHAQVNKLGETLKPKGKKSGATAKKDTQSTQQSRSHSRKRKAGLTIQHVSKRQLDNSQRSDIMNREILYYKAKERICKGQDASMRDSEYKETTMVDDNSQSQKTHFKGKMSRCSNRYYGRADKISSFHLGPSESKGFNFNTRDSESHRAGKSNHIKIKPRKLPRDKSAVPNASRTRLPRELDAKKTSQSVLRNGPESRFQAGESNDRFDPTRISVAPPSGQGNILFAPNAMSMPHLIPSHMMLSSGTSNFENKFFDEASHISSSTNNKGRIPKQAKVIKGNQLGMTATFQKSPAHKDQRKLKILSQVLHESDLRADEEYQMRKRASKMDQFMKDVSSTKNQKYIQKLNEDQLEDIDKANALAQAMPSNPVFPTQEDEVLMNSFRVADPPRTSASILDSKRLGKVGSGLRTAKGLLKDL